MRFFHRNGPAGSSQGGNETVGATFDGQAQSLIPAEVRLISGCHSEQTSADVADASRVAQLPNPAGRSGGACTLALLDILYASSAPGGGSPSSGTTITSTNKNSSNLTFQELLLRLRESLAAKGLSQIPQLTSSRPLELKHTPFSLSSGPRQRRALLVGINYLGQSGELRGCHNDIVNVRRYLIDRQGYSPNNILVLLDDGKHIFPTRQKIILGLQQLVEHSRSGDNVYFHYSGHGGLLSPEGFNSFKLNHKEYDETLFPVDHERSGQIRDFSLFQHFVKPMAEGVTVTAVLDCCHSGSVLDLPYSYQPTPGGQIQMQKNFDSLSNLAFLYILAGGFLPDGFGNVTDYLSNVLGQPVDGYHGAAASELESADLMDDSAVQKASDYTPTPDVNDYEESTERQNEDNYAEYGVDPGSAAFESRGVSDDLGGNDLSNIPPYEYSNLGYGQGFGAGEATLAQEPDTAPDDSECACGEGLADVLSSLLDSEE